MKNKLGVDTSLLMKQTGKLARGFSSGLLTFKTTLHMFAGLTEVLYFSALAYMRFAPHWV